MVARALEVSHPSYRRVSGGCIAHAARVDGPDGPLAFLKWSAAGDPAAATYRAEETGLGALAGAGAVRVPRVLARLAAADAAGLLLEWLPPRRADRVAWSRFGRALARLHRPLAGATAGWDADNFIGPLPQENALADGWGDFWWRRRLLPQLRRGRAASGSLGERVAALEARLEPLAAPLAEALDEAAEADGIALLHGDLWSGNVHFTEDGRGGVEAALIDPSVYRGHREVDLGMAALFGGFPDAFLDAYEAEASLLHGAERRRPAYQLYYLLVHVNLFGESYLAGTERAVDALEGWVAGGDATGARG